MARPNIIGQMPRIRGNTRPPPGASPTGEILPDGRLVYIESVKIMGRRPRRDADGEILYHTAPDGRRIRAQYEAFVERVEQREFVIEDLGNNITQRNFHFRPAPEELAAQERARFREEALEELSEVATEMKEAGLSFRDLVAALRTAVRGGDSDEPEKGGVPERGSAEAKERMARVRAARGQQQ